MADGPTGEDELDRKMRELGERAQEAYDEDALAAAIRVMEDEYRDFTRMPTHDFFVEGYGHALHSVKRMYISSSGEFPCSCPNSRPFPEERRDGTWRCGDCDCWLADDDDVVERAHD